MGTRGVIARVGKNEGEFSGVYHHWDSMPTSLGRTLVELHRNFFKRDLARMLQVLIDQHNAWSTIVGKDFRLKPGYSNNYKRLNPACFCHGTRHEDNPRITHEHMNDTDVEWVYAFDEEKNRLYIRDIRHKEDAGIVELADHPLNEKQWYEIECGEDFHRCSHYAWAHDLAPKSCNLSTQTWLGRKPFEFHDAVAFIISGKRYASTGCGGSSEYYSTPIARQHGFAKNFPARTWVASVKAGNGRRIDFPVAKVTEDGYKPLPGVLWIYPPTKDNPQETSVSA